MNAQEIQLLVSSELQRYNLRKKEFQKAPTYNPRAFMFYPNQTDIYYRPPQDLYYGDAEIETLCGEKLSSHSVGADVVYSNERVVFYALGSHIYVKEQDIAAPTVYKGHSGAVTDIQYIFKDLLSTRKSKNKSADESIYIASADQSNKVILWAYSPRQIESKEKKSPFKTYCTLNLDKELGYAVRINCVSADAGKIIRMFLLLSTGQLNCYDLQSDIESNRKNSCTEKSRTIVTQCESAVRKMCASGDCLVLSTRDRVTGFCPYMLQPVFDFDCSYKQPEGPARPQITQNVTFLHIIDRSTVAIATDVTFQLWNISQQSPVLIQRIRMDLSKYKLQGVTPASNREHIHMQEQAIDNLKKSLSEMVDSEAHELLRDFSTCRDLKWCFIAHPLIGEPTTGQNVPMLMLHLIYGPKGWTVDYILPFDTLGPAASFHIAPLLEKSEDGRSQYSLMTMHSQYIGKMLVKNTNQSSKVARVPAEPLRSSTPVENDEVEIAEVNSNDSEEKLSSKREEKEESLLTKFPQLKIATQASDEDKGERIAVEKLKPLIEKSVQQCSQLDALGAQLEEWANNLDNSTSAIEGKMQESLDSTLGYMQKKIDQLRLRIKKQTKVVQDRLNESMKEYADRCVEACTHAIEESFKNQMGKQSSVQTRHTMLTKAKSLSDTLFEKVRKRFYEVSCQALEKEHGKIRVELEEWKGKISQSIDSIQKGIENLKNCAVAENAAPAPPRETFTYEKAEELIEKEEIGRALTLASETDSFEPLAFCFEKITDHRYEKGLVFTHANLTTAHAIRILDILSQDLGDAATIDMRLEWMQVLSMSEIYMANEKDLITVKQATVEKLQKAKENRTLSSLQLYRIKILINMLCASI